MISRIHIHNVIDCKVIIEDKGILRIMTIETKDGHTTEIFIYMEDE